MSHTRTSRMHDYTYRAKLPRQRLFTLLPKKSPESVHTHFLYTVVRQLSLFILGTALWPSDERLATRPSWLPDLIWNAQLPRRAFFLRERQTRMRRVNLGSYFAPHFVSSPSPRLFALTSTFTFTFLPPGALTATRVSGTRGS